MFCGVSEVHYIRNDECYCTSEEHRLMYAEVIGHRTADENPNSDADVPAAEVGAVSGAALVMAS